MINATATTANTANTTFGTRTRKGLIGWLVSLNAAYRQRHALNNAADEQLADMGMTREDAEHAFLTRYGANRWTPRSN